MSHTNEGNQQSNIASDFDDLRRVTYRPPELSVFDRIVAFILCQHSKGHELDRNDIDVVTYLTGECAVPFDPKNAAHVQLFQQLHLLVFRKQITNPLSSDNWVRFGFQNSHPETDIRSGGLLSIEVMLHIAKNYPDFIVEVLEHVDTVGNYFFACSVISSTFFLKQYFHFNEDTTNGYYLNSMKMAHRDNLKLLLFLMRKEGTTKSKYRESFIELIAVYSIRLFDHWKILEDENPLTVVSFTKVMTEYETGFHKFMKNAVTNPPFSFSELVNSLKMKRFNIKA